MSKRRINLGFKLIICLIGSMVLIFSALICFTSFMHRQHLENAIIDSALRVSDTIERSTHHDMLHSQPEETGHISRIINSIGDLKGIERVRIFNKQGKILYSTDEHELQQLVNKKAESCYVCHSQEEPLKKLDKQQRWRIFDSKDGHRVLGLIKPIENEESCSARGCHPSPQQTALLGVLDVNMSLKEVDDQITADLTGMLIAYLLTMTAIAVVSGLFVLVMVHRPVKKLIDGTRRVARGELNHRMDLHSGDEIGELADSFNRMTQDLRLARDEITNWAKTLERRVTEKTEELKQAQESIIRVEKMASLGRLSAIVAHEINNPLAGVLTYARLMHRKLERRSGEGEYTADQEFEDCKKYLSIIESETARCGDIVKNLLLFSKKTAIQLQPNDLNKLLQNSIMLVNHQMELQSIKCETDLDTNLPQVTCDGSQIQQMIVALLINACEAIGENGKINVSSRYDKRRNTVQLGISDNGVGMDEETKKHIFEPFFSTKQGGNGTGLGLAVVFGIVERHGGTISVDSALGKGATFTVELPLHAPQSAAEIGAFSTERSQGV